MKNCLDSDWLRAVQFLVDKVKKTRKKFSFKNAVIGQCTETMQFVSKQQMRILFSRAQAVILFFLLSLTGKGQIS